VKRDSLICDTFLNDKEKCCQFFFETLGVTGRVRQKCVRDWYDEMVFVIIFWVISNIMPK